MPAILEWVSGDKSPFSLSASMETASGNATYLLHNVTSLNDIYNTIILLLGDVNNDVSADGSVQRILPTKHPFMGWYVHGISMKGVGGQYTPLTNAPNIFNPIITNYCLYAEYELTIQFAPRPYAIYDNLQITAASGSWYPETDGGTTPEDFEYFNEWERFASLDIKPSSDTVTMQLGQLAFNAVGVPLDGRPFTGMPKIFLNNEMFTVTWWNLPLRFYTSDNSYLRKWRGRVNQNTWTTKAFGTYEPGELLYLGSQLKPYTPPFNNQIIYAPGLQNYDRYVNIEMSFLYTKRVRGAEPAEPPVNNNYIAAGHNLQPFFGNSTDTLNRTFLYASTVPTDGPNSAGLWQSFPIEMMFTDPDSPTAI